MSERARASLSLSLPSSEAQAGPRLPSPSLPPRRASMIYALVARTVSVAAAFVAVAIGRAGQGRARDQREDAATEKTKGPKRKECWR